MAKGEKLTDRERGPIEALSSTEMSSRAIAIKTGRSKTVVNNFLKLKDNYGKKNTGGRPKALSSRDERRVCQLASTGNNPFAYTPDNAKQSQYMLIILQFQLLLYEMQLQNFAENHVHGMPSARALQRPLTEAFEKLKILQ
ncbi:hypothetical protein HNY73_021331 [Argiope bruennichi]|uniref:Tc3 transposase DNA binding domain-containing protein n=1 Tax=Argiope bruennichi TaxID=94029 RepID=A0A8T0DXX9_ARGBR|nr:hypothetical protein HNY73_021331 [Argiope bruennichi]